MLSNILVVAGLFAVAMTAQVAKDPAKMTLKFQPQKMEVSPQPTPTPTATPTIAAKSISEQGVKGLPPKSPPPRKPCKTCVKF